MRGGVGGVGRGGTGWDGWAGVRYIGKEGRCLYMISLAWEWMGW